MFVSLIFVSRLTAKTRVDKADMEAVVAKLAARNAAIGVRGTLIVTEWHAAQIIEGPADQVDGLMRRIIEDAGEEQVTIIERKPIDGYRFSSWSLGYWGDASYMDRKIGAVLDRHDAVMHAGHTAQLYDLMLLLARESCKRQGPIGNSFTV